LEVEGRNQEAKVCRNE